MLTDYGQIVIHELEGPLNSRALRYEWEGPNQAMINDRYLPHGVQAGDMVTVGPYRVRLIERDVLIRGWIVQRGNPIRSWFTYQSYRLARPLDDVYRRLILTAAVWGLAEYHEYMIPSWRDLYVVKWFGRRRVD